MARSNNLKPTVASGYRETKKPGLNRFSRLESLPFPEIVGALFLVLLVVVSTRHEMWRDEIQIFTIAKQMTSLSDIIRIIDWEPHPATWYLMLAALSHLTGNPFAVQLLHAWIASAGAYVFLRFAPLPRLQRALFVFGFFPFFQYGVVSRSYALGILLAFVCLALWKSRWKRLWLIAGTLFLLANCSAQGVLLACVIGLTVGFAWGYDRRKGRDIEAGVWKMAGAGALVACGIALSLIQIAVPAESLGEASQSGATYFHYTLEQVAGMLSNVYLYNFGKIPALNGVLASVLLLAAMIAAFARRPVALFAYSCGTFLVLAAVYVKQFGFLWHLGHLYVVFGIALWLAGYYAKTEPQRGAWPIERAGKWAVYGVLVFQLGPCASAAYLDFRWPYSSGKAAAGFIARDPYLRDLPIAGDLDYVASTVCGYLDKRIDYIADGEDGVTALWGGMFLRGQHLKPNEFVRRTRLLAAREHNDVLLLLSYELNRDFQQMLGARLMQSFPESIAGFIEKEPACSERYWIYVVKRSAIAAAEECEKGEAILAGGRLDEAREDFERAIQADPDYAISYNDLGVLLCMQGSPLEALPRFHTALRLNDAYAAAHVNLARAYRTLGRAEESAKEIEAARALGAKIPGDLAGKAVDR